MRQLREHQRVLVSFMERRVQFVMCVKNDGYLASLELRKAYRLLEDEPASRRGLLRVVDESGEDYLYPEEYFRQ